ncbi:MAG: serine/threonine protein phosphatase, partial [Mesorhizobium sp.]
YALVAALALAGAVAGAFVSVLWLILLWPALALAIVAFAYAGAGARVFQKAADGSISLASRVLLLLYRLGARINAWIWTRKLPPHVAIADGVFLGRFPTAAEGDAFGTVIDLAGELERPRGVTCRWTAVAMVDLLPPSPEAQAQAVAAIEDARSHGTVLVCCALGFQRSAGVVAEWLVTSGRSPTPAQAHKRLAASGRPVHLRIAADEPA